MIDDVMGLREDIRMFFRGKEKIEQLEERLSLLRRSAVQVETRHRTEMQTYRELMILGAQALDHGSDRQKVSTALWEASSGLPSGIHQALATLLVKEDGMP